MASLLLVPFQPKLLKKFHIKAASNSIRNEKTSSFSFRSKANVPIYELPGASFDQYMDDKQRVFRAVFSDNKGLTTQLNEPTADVRLTFKSNGEDYPPHIPHHVTKVLELHFIRWELQGLNTFNKNPYHISLDVKGSLYPERKGKYSWLKNQMEMKITFCVSPGTTFIPENILEDALELVFKTVLDEMKQEFHGRLLEDYNRFKRNKSKKNSV
ncbi:uncharacterized protein LOC109819128 isoform X2 [Cajanus cajan]|uniref:uncharacterized protein LOC109819128 isoform X2 n=1 Tax=Cajanus cajan TaxID=3821 RepID=UPI0010FAEA99|nr:uncharacterized protein LOC109819128 isoform X2 [Cajanus cajan]